MQNLWFRMAERNPMCDAMIVDSCSPMLPHVPSSVWYYGFEDNVGHLSRGGRDGWGRAFCYGLSYAVAEGYDWAAHVECDSVCKLDLMCEVERLQDSCVDVATIPLSSWPGQIETGLMLFSTQWLRETDFVSKYDWSGRGRYPEPEKVVKTLCGEDCELQSWRGMRDDFHELTPENVASRKLDWLTHATLPVVEKFVALS